MKGIVLDVGGKKIDRRGTFIPPLDQVNSWKYLNPDDKTKPDYCCSAENIPLEDESVDTVIMTEVLEYLTKPEIVISEIYRVLCENGHLIISTPFLNPIHGDYWSDRARYTPVMLKEKLEGTGFKLKSLEPMGSVGSVLYDILRVAFGYADERGKFGICGRILPRMRFFFSWLDRKMGTQRKYINSGYFLVLSK